MLSQDGFFRPAAGAIEFSHHHGLIIELQLIDAVLVTVENDKPSRTPATASFHCIQDIFRGEIVEFPCEGVRSEGLVHILCLIHKAALSRVATGLNASDANGHREDSLRLR